MSWLTTDPVLVGQTAGKIALLYLAALIGLRLTVRRVAGQITIYDAVAMVSVGAIIGRTATASGTAFVQGLVALVVLLACHEVVSRLRLRRGVRALTDHKVRVLVHDGVIDHEQLKLCQLTESDLWASLRIRGITSLDDVRFVLYESQGTVSVVKAGEPVGELVRTVVGPADGDRRGGTGT
ncbi:DUF421 domain-containing protein [Prauserella muralis]|uniref:YetF C-terminal domain-containing protein n=1 Tax=Prauserella muralis TaxID=588067 RepID=A0A2V4APM0_9PSEU|nr:YetF domain-containing protein [Prauserella muralis]PXY22653.1 hypothetical protein BAY60_22810 [Prauserella muralis]TWE28364.1 uncharacterized protein DUF421 [Prauserella muralis]